MKQEINATVADNEEIIADIRNKFTPIMTLHEILIAGCMPTDELIKKSLQSVQYTLDVINELVPTS